MEKNHPKKAEQPFLTKVLPVREGDQTKPILVKVFAPSREDGIYSCAYEIWIGNELVRVSAVTGGDDVHALLLALWKIETDLKHKVPFSSMDIEHDEFFGFGFIHSNRVWESVYKLA